MPLHLQLLLHCKVLHGYTRYSYKNKKYAFNQRERERLSYLFENSWGLVGWGVLKKEKYNKTQVNVIVNVP